MAGDASGVRRQGAAIGSIQVNQRRIGPRLPVYVVAEISANHHHDFEQAVRLVHAAKEAGADAGKLQTYTPDTLTVDCQSEPFRIQGSAWDGRDLHDLYKKAYMPWAWQTATLAVAG